MISKNHHSVRIFVPVNGVPGCPLMGTREYEVICKRGSDDDAAKKNIEHPDSERKDWDLRLTKNYLVLFGMILVKRTQVERAVSIPMTPWLSIIEVSEHIIFLDVCSTEYALNMTVFSIFFV